MDGTFAAYNPVTGARELCDAEGAGGDDGGGPEGSEGE